MPLLLHSPSPRVPATAEAKATPKTGLPSLFKPEQYVSCVVLSSGAGTDNMLTRLVSGVKAKHNKVQVSLRPDLVNDSTSFEHLAVAGAVVWGAVVSREDHGCVASVFSLLHPPCGWCSGLNQPAQRSMRLSPFASMGLCCQR